MSLLEAVSLLFAQGLRNTSFLKGYCARSIWYKMLAMVFAAEDDWRGGMKIWRREACSSLSLLLLFLLSCYTLMLFPSRDASLRIDSCLLCLQRCSRSEFALILVGKKKIQTIDKTLSGVLDFVFHIAWEYLSSLTDLRKK